MNAPKESTFVERRRAEWDELDAIVQRARGGVKKLEPILIAKLSPLYRDVCADLARARAARYSAPLIEYLDGLTASSHALLYGKPSRALASRFAEAGMRSMPALVAFPRAVRRRWRAVALASGLFFIPLVIGVVVAHSAPSLGVSMVPQA